MVREEDGERPLAVGDHQLDAQARALGRPELESDLAHCRATFAVSGGHRAAQIVGRRWHRAEDPVLYLRAQGALLPRPDGRRGDGDSPAVLAQHQRIGQIGNRRHRVEVRRQLPGPPQPVLPSTIVRVHPPRGRRAAGLKQLQELVADPSLRVRSGLRLHDHRREADRAQQPYRWPASHRPCSDSSLGYFGPALHPGQPPRFAMTSSGSLAPAVILSVIVSPLTVPL